MVDKIIEGRKYRIDWEGDASVKNRVKNGRVVFGIGCNVIKKLAYSRKAFVAKSVSENPAYAEGERYACRLEGELRQYYWPNCLLAEVPDKKKPDEVIVIKRYGDVTEAYYKQPGYIGERRAQVKRYSEDMPNMHTACEYLLDKLFYDDPTGSVEADVVTIIKALKEHGLKIVKDR